MPKAKIIFTSDDNDEKTTIVTVNEDVDGGMTLKVEFLPEGQKTSEDMSLGQTLAMHFLKSLTE